MRQGWGEGVLYCSLGIISTFKPPKKFFEKKNFVFKLI